MSGSTLSRARSRHCGSRCASCQAANSAASSAAPALPAPASTAEPITPRSSRTSAGPALAALPPAPAGATYLRFELTCYDGARCGSPAGGIDGDPSYVKVEQGALPLTGAPDPGNVQDLDPTDPGHGFPVDVDPGTRWRLYAVYTDTLNPAQDSAGPGGSLTLGIPGNGAPPDLVPMTAGNGLPGYVEHRLLTTDYSSSPRGTRPALTPDGTSQAALPVYADDGTTIIGHAQVDAPHAAAGRPVASAAELFGVWGTARLDGRDVGGARDVDGDPLSVRFGQDEGGPWWAAGDGCNQTSGRFRVGPGGRFSAEAVVTTSRGCFQGVEHPRNPAAVLAADQARLVGAADADGRRLVLLAAGQVVAVYADAQQAAGP